MKKRATLVLVKPEGNEERSDLGSGERDYERRYSARQGGRKKRGLLDKPVDLLFHDIYSDQNFYPIIPHIFRIVWIILPACSIKQPNSAPSSEPNVRASAQLEQM